MCLAQRLLAIAVMVCGCSVTDDSKTIVVTHAELSTSQDQVCVWGLSDGQAVSLLVDSVLESDTALSTIPPPSPRDICFRCDEPPCSPCRCERIPCP